MNAHQICRRMWFALGFLVFGAILVSFAVLAELLRPERGSSPLDNTASTSASRPSSINESNKSRVTLARANLPDGVEYQLIRDGIPQWSMQFESPFEMTALSPDGALCGIDTCDRQDEPGLGGAWRWVIVDSNGHVILDQVVTMELDGWVRTNPPNWLGPLPTELRWNDSDGCFEILGIDARNRAEDKDGPATLLRWTADPKSAEWAVNRHQPPAFALECSPCSTFGLVPIPGTSAYASVWMRIEPLPPEKPERICTSYVQLIGADGSTILEDHGEIRMDRSMLIDSLHDAWINGELQDIVVAHQFVALRQGESFRELELAEDGRVIADQLIPVMGER